MASDVDAYIEQLQPPVRELAREVHRIISDELPDVEAAIKWSQPTYMLRGKGLAYLRAARAHLTFGFMEGQRLSDADGLLEGSGKQMAHVKLRGQGDLDEDRVRGWLREAAGLVGS
jgi:hypothetical protein